MLKLDQKPWVVIIGRPNVGKSTLFNRLIEEEKAIVSEIPGTTRDLISGQCFWRDQRFTLVDTGGLEIIEPKKIKKITPERIKTLEDLGWLVEKRILALIKETDLIVFLVDTKTGPLPQEKKIALVLKKLKKPVLLVANKADNPDLREKAWDPAWQRLGLGQPLPVSAANGSGTGDLLDEIVKLLSHAGQVAGLSAGEFELEPIKISIVGKPNVGKSSLLNALLGEERVIVSELPYTTRESIDTLLRYQNKSFLLIDTAGLRKKSKIPPGTERLSAKRTLASLKKSDIVFLVTEVQKPITAEDRRLAGLAEEQLKGLVIIANKWDLIKNKSTKTQNQFIKYYYQQFPNLSFVPIAFVSARTHEKVNQLLDLALEIKGTMEKIIEPKELAEIIKPFPRTLALNQIKQVGINPPTFLIISRAKPPFPPYLARALEKALRKKFDFLGTPIKVIIKSTRR